MEHVHTGSRLSRTLWFDHRREPTEPCSPPGTEKMTAAVLAPQGQLPMCPESIDFTEAIKIQKHVAAMMEFSRNYVSTFYKLTVSINQLCEENFTGNAIAQSTIHSLSDACGRTVCLTKDFHEQSCMTLYSQLTSFLKTDLVKVQEARAHFDSMSASMDEALSRNASSTKARPSDAADGRNALTAVGACFAHTTLDYVAQINIAHAQKDHLIIDALWSFIRETSSYFSRGHAIFDDWTAADNGAVSDSIAALAAKSRLVQRKMQDIHSLVPKSLNLIISSICARKPQECSTHLVKKLSDYLIWFLIPGFHVEHPFPLASTKTSFYL
ncbi:hypothetical protein ANCCEY_01139 [Ancylostoma ceylanicum]|uniref:BAR domain-containing protein n=1 Tax=Ancylostoma ceylanicum TaxID=53326 RepID=A0A0D6M6P5_9BILA|nr:hypothetical protein ANCCEY_01139 [Ancylostoma ceylanicum]